MVGFVVGFVTVEYRIGVVCLAVAGGLSFGIRVVLLRDGLLFPIFFLNWAFVAFGGIGGGIGAVYRERNSVVCIAGPG